VDDAPGRITHEIQAAAKSLKVHVVWASYRRGPERGVIYNSSILIGPDGEIIGTYDKTHPFPLERCDCGGWVTVGNRADVFETALGTIGMIVCYDGDFPELSRLLAVKGARSLSGPRPCSAVLTSGISPIPPALTITTLHGRHQRRGPDAGAAIISATA